MPERDRDVLAIKPNQLLWGVSRTSVFRASTTNSDIFATLYYTTFCAFTPKMDL